MTPVPSLRDFQNNDDSNIAQMVSELEIESESDDGSELNNEVDDRICLVFTTSKKRVQQMIDDTIQDQWRKMGNMK